MEGALMPHRIVNPPELDAPRGFSHAVVAGDTVYLAGQIGEGRRSSSSSMPRSGNWSWRCVRAGGEPADLVSLQVFVTDVGAYRDVAAGAWAQHGESISGRHYPAMGLFGVAEPVRTLGDGRGDGRCGRSPRRLGQLNLNQANPMLGESGLAVRQVQAP